MTNAGGRIEAVADAAALARAELEHDTDARQAILSAADLEQVSCVLARILNGVLRAEAGGCSGGASEFIKFWQSEVRHVLAGITEG